LIHKKDKIHLDALSRRRNDKSDYVTGDEEFAGWVDGEENEFVLVSMQEIDDYAAIKFNIQSSEKQCLLLHHDADPLLAEVKEYTRLQKLPSRKFPEAWVRNNFKRFILKNEVLHRKLYSEAIHAPVLQAVIPSSLIQEVMDDAHGSKFAGHPSAAKMQTKLARDATWPTMVRDISKFVATCKICNKMRPTIPEGKTPLQPIIAENVFNHIICDLPKLLVAPGGFQYVLVFKREVAPL
jgi:hypothetical protein